MVGWRRKCKVKKKVNSVNGGKKKRMKEEAKRTRESQKVGGQNSALTLKTQLSWLSQLQKNSFSFTFLLFFSFLLLKKFMKREASYRFPKKKKKREKRKFLEQIKDKIFTFKFQIPNFQFKIFIPKLKITHSKFQIQSQVSSFKISNCKFSKSQVLKFQVANFQISNSLFQISRSQVSSFKISSFKIPKFQFSKFQVSNPKL